MKEPDQETEEKPAAKKVSLSALLLRNEILMPVITLLAAAVVFSIPAIHEHVNKVRKAAEYAHQHKSQFALEEGLQLASVPATREQAPALMHHALESALTPVARQNALLALGEFLLEEARKSPETYALPARQYFNITLAEEQRSPQRLLALRGLLTVARLRADLDDLRDVFVKIHDEKMSDADRVAFLTTQLDIMLSMGDWKDLSGLLQELLPFESDPRFSIEVSLRWAAVHEQVLNRKEYFASWRKRLAEAGDPATDEQLRGNLYTNLLVKLDALGSGASGLVADEARFRAFRLVFKAGLYDDAGLRLEKLHVKALGPLEKEARLISIQIKRHNNHLRVFQEDVLRYVELFEIDAEIEPYFFETLDLRISNGKGAEVVTLLEQKLAQCTDQEQRARLLLYTGDLSRRLQSDAVALRCYQDILDMPRAKAYHPKAILAQCGIHTSHGDLAAACRNLYTYLTHYPDAQDWRDAAKALVGQLRGKPEKGGSDLITVAIHLSNSKPSDPMAAEFLSLVAQQMENLGLITLAHNYYNRTLLQPVQSATPTPVELQQQDDMPAAVLLGNARCLMDLNRTLEADRLLRHICRQPIPSATRSEAALLWAGIAMENDQKREGHRRLDLVDPRHSDTNVSWQAHVQRLLLQVSGASNATSAVADVLTTMKDPVATAHPELVRKVYLSCLEALEANHDAAGLHQILASTNAVLSAGMLDEFRLRVAGHYLANQDYTAAGEWMQQSSLTVSNVVAVITKNNQMLRNFR